jgi:hypothetical protein
LPAPRRQAILGFGQELLKQTAEGLNEAAEGHVARNLIELAAGEVASRADDRSVQLLNQRRLAHAGCAADECQA